MRRPIFKLNIKFPEGYIAPAFIAFSAGIILAANYFISRQDNLYRVDILTSELKGSANGLVSPILLSDLTANEQAAQVKVESNNTIKCLTISEYLSGQKINLTTILRTSRKSIGPTYSDQIALGTCGNSESNIFHSFFEKQQLPTFEVSLCGLCHFKLLSHFHQTWVEQSFGNSVVVFQMIRVF